MRHKHRYQPQQEALALRLLEEHQQLMLREAARLTKTEQDRDDLFQDAVVCMLNYLDRLAQMSSRSAAAYLVFLVRSRFIDRMRQEHPSQWTDLDEELLWKAIDSQQNDGRPSPYLRSELQILLDDLDAKDRTLLVNYYILGMTAQELGDKMNCSANTVRSQIHRIKKRVKEVWKLNWEDLL